MFRRALTVLLAAGALTLAGAGAAAAGEPQAPRTVLYVVVIVDGQPVLCPITVAAHVVA